MALRMLHLLAYNCEDGLLVSMHDDHVDRDRDYEAALIEWERIGGKAGKAPCLRLDTYIPIEATNDHIRAMIQRVIMRIELIRLLKDILG